MVRCSNFKKSAIVKSANELACLNLRSTPYRGGLLNIDALEHWNWALATFIPPISIFARNPLKSFQPAPLKRSRYANEEK